jgi:uncharacterized damage-inducible protein DinB
MRTRVLALLLAAAPVLLAQTSVKDALVKHWKTAGEFTIAVANAMPASDYNFRPNPEEMSFGQLMAHIGAADVGVCALASGMKRPDDPPKIAAWRKDSKLEIDKDTAVAYLTSTFGFCDEAVASMTPEKLDAVVGPGSRKMTGFEWLWAYFTHTAHHRGQAEVYLRVKGVKPPEYVF